MKNMERKKKEQKHGRTNKRRLILNPMIQLAIVNLHTKYEVSILNSFRDFISVSEDQKRLPSFYWLPKLHKQPYKARFIANSSLCTTTERSKLLISCLTTIKHHVIKYCDKVHESPVKIFFGQSNIHVRY